ncbi:hypothetical protein MW887_000579 [Aspergillus wentii]|nr:hypothetical protein MW887_000579 [Aspergillus wentii]
MWPMIRCISHSGADRELFAPLISSHRAPKKRVHPGANSLAGPIHTYHINDWFGTGSGPVPHPHRLRDNAWIGSVHNAVGGITRLASQQAGRRIPSLRGALKPLLSLESYCSDSGSQQIVQTMSS